MAVAYDDFEQFALAVRAHHRLHPDHVRLNGEPTGGDRNAWCYFWHRNRRWKVDADTHIAPILAAYTYFVCNAGADPFRLDESPARTRDSLVVVREVRDELIRQDSRYRRHNYHYIYAPRRRVPATC